MSTFQTPPGRHVFNGESEGNIIREIFYRHWEGMKEKMNTTRKEIDRWRQVSIANIDRHAEEQIRILQHDYNVQRYTFDESRRQNLDTAMAYHYHSQQTSELFVQLREACRKLDFQVASLGIIRQNVDYIKVITVNEREKKEREDRARQQSITASANTPMNPGSSSNSTPTSTNSRQPWRPNTPNSTSRTDHSIYDDTPIDKCPICFMIYPQAMNLDARTAHVNDHD